LGKALCEASGGKDAPLRRPKGATNGRRLFCLFTDALSVISCRAGYKHRADRKSTDSLYINKVLNRNDEPEN
jgi:hypothetical protein